MVIKRGSEKAALHQVVRTAKQKQIFMFFVWLNLLPQMQVFEHCLLKKVVTTSCHNFFITV